MEQQGEIILYQPDESVRMEVRIEDETVWLTQAQIAELFETKRQAIGMKHLKNIFQSGELNENALCSILELTASEPPKAVSVPAATLTQDPRPNASKGKELDLPRGRLPKGAGTPDCLPAGYLLGRD